MKWISIVCGIISLISIGIGMLMVILGIQETYIEETKCYDRYSHEIEGLVCYKETFEGENLGVSLLLLGASGIVISALWEVIYI